MSPRWPLSLALWLALGGLACVPELEPIRWEAIDIEALRDAVASPTGIVDEQSTQEIADSLVRDNDAYQVLAQYIRAVFSATASPDGPGPRWLIPQALGGTSIYALVACPGTELDGGEFSFANGFMQIDSPTLTAELVSSFEVSGDLLLSFVGCRIGELVFDGGAPAHYVSDPIEIGVIPRDLRYELLGSDEPYTIEQPLLWSESDQLSLLFTLDSGETLALDWQGDGDELDAELRGANGSLICSLLESGLSCVPP